MNGCSLSNALMVLTNIDMASSYGMNSLHRAMDKDITDIDESSRKRGNG